MGGKAGTATRVKCGDFSQAMTPREQRRGLRGAVSKGAVVNKQESAIYLDSDLPIFEALDLVISQARSMMLHLGGISLGQRDKIRFLAELQATPIDAPLPAEVFGRAFPPWRIGRWRGVDVLEGHGSRAWVSGDVYMADATPGAD